MRVINKKISYDSLKSRFPGTVPAIVDSWEIPQLYKNCGSLNNNETYYSYSTAVKRASEYNIKSSQLEYKAQFIGFDDENMSEFTTGNYGLIPSDVIIPNEISNTITDYTDIYVNIPDENGGFYDLSWPKNESDPHYEGRKIISGGTEIKILTYHTLNKWYSFFKKYYELIEDYEHNIVYESAIDYYNKEVKVKNEENEMYYKSLDDTFYSRGGKVMYDWINNLNIDKKYATNSASLTIPISITTSIDDLGEMTIFSNKWVEDEDYHNTLTTDEESGGTIMNSPYLKYFKCKQCGFEAKSTEFVNDRCPICGCEEYEIYDATLYETYMIKGGQEHIGHGYNEFYENTFKEDDWINYTEYYIKNNLDEFSSYGVSSFTYSPINGQIIYNPTEITKNINVVNSACVCIEGNTYDIIVNGEYVVLCYSSNNIADLKYKKQTKLQVFKDGNTEYAVLNGKRKYVETDPLEPQTKKIYFLRESNCNDSGCTVYSGNYIVFDNCLYFVNDNYIVIDDADSTLKYPLLDGYFDIEDNRFYISGDTVVIQDSAIYNEDINQYVYTFKPINEDDNTLRIFNIKKIEVSDDKSYVTLFYSFDEHKCNLISGYTDSKVDVLRRKEISTDDLGNELPGYFRSIVDITGGTRQSKYNLPYDECVLDILYKVGEVSGLEFIGIENDKSLFIGNILTDISFYYVDEFGKQIPETVKHTNGDNALETIDECKATYKEGMSNIMLCDITYHLGAVIEKSGSTYSMKTDTHTGVKYVDTVYVTKEVGTYYINNDKQLTFNYYMLTQNVDTIHVTDFNANVICDISTYFEMEILVYDDEGKYDEKFIDFDNNNGVIVSPVLRTEFNLASSMPQNVESDIYIDRGINAAFEKQLKLQELRSMEALENYGNSWFKINEY